MDHVQIVIVFSRMSSWYDKIYLGIDGNNITLFYNFSSLVEPYAIGEVYIKNFFNIYLTQIKGNMPRVYHESSIQIFTDI